MLITPSKSSCSKLGHKFAIFSKSRSVSPRIAAKNSFLRFGQPFNRRSRLSPGDASSRKLVKVSIKYFIHFAIFEQCMLRMLTTTQNPLLPIRGTKLPMLEDQQTRGHVISTYPPTEDVHYSVTMLWQLDPCSPD